MKVGILGTGDVGRTLGLAFIDTGHEVRMGSRTADNPGAKTWATEAGDRASTGTFADTAAWADLIVIALLGVITEDVLRQIGEDAFRAKDVIDTTNPLDFSAGFPPSMFVGHTDSLGERVQRALPGARVVKAFNSVGHAHMYKPDFPDGPPTMFICGNDDGAIERVTSILDDFGWETSALGGIEVSRHLESLCLVWVLHGARTGRWDHAFRILQR
jgi:predicted dinucleotide-binding enzyme